MSKSMEEHPQRFCRKCLLEDIAEEDFLRNMHQYIDGLDEDIKTEEAQYRQRLLLCRQCSKLMNGLCRVCGCFVEYRAAVKKNHCPGPEKLW